MEAPNIIHQITPPPPFQVKAVAAFLPRCNPNITSDAKVPHSDYNDNNYL
jgi:hypothetical protein